MSERPSAGLALLLPFVLVRLGMWLGRAVPARTAAVGGRPSAPAH